MLPFFNSPLEHALTRTRYQSRSQDVSLSQMLSNSTHRIIEIYGMDGVGKSSMVSQALHQFADTKLQNLECIAWINGTDASTISQSLIAILEDIAFNESETKAWLKLLLASEALSKESLNNIPWSMLVRITQGLPNLTENLFREYKKNSPDNINWPIAVLIVRLYASLGRFLHHARVHLNENTFSKVSLGSL